MVVWATDDKYTEELFFSSSIALIIADHVGALFWYPFITQ